MGKKRRASRPDKPIVLSLPGDLLHDIGSWLNEQELCKMELASNELKNVLLSPNGTGPCKRLLDLRIPRLRALSPEALRSSNEPTSCPAILRVSEAAVQSDADYDDAIKAQKRCSAGGSRRGCSGGMVPPVLPSLLAACAPAAELELAVTSTEGEKFFAMSPGSSASGAGPQLSTFWADLARHLTDLKLLIYCNLDEAHDLGTLSTLTALQKLSIAVDVPESMWEDMSEDDDDSELRLYYSLSGKELPLTLPHLTSLSLYEFQKGKIVLSCPKLADLTVSSTKSLCIVVEEAALEALTLMRCEEIQFALKLPRNQLQNLKVLDVLSCSELSRHLIQDVGQMGSLQKLDYVDFPGAAMPSSFPQSLQKVDLRANDWCLDLPSGLRDLHELRDFYFSSSCRPWRFTRPLGELLPMDSLESVRVGNIHGRRNGQEAKWEELKEHTLAVMTN